jgi:hypothetical protein
MEVGEWRRLVVDRLARCGRNLGIYCAEVITWLSHGLWLDCKHVFEAVLALHLFFFVFNM